MEEASVTPWLISGKRANWGKHRTEVTEVTEGEHYGGEASVTPWLMGGKRANWGKHRTEVTEVTEGELAFVGERLR